MVKTRKRKEQEVFGIASRYRNEPIKVSFFTKDAKRVDPKLVKKIATKEGTKFFLISK